MTAEALWLLSSLLVAHYLGDFTPLATGRMQEAKASGGPLRFIAGHAAVHGVLVALAVAILTDAPAVVVGTALAIEFVTHFGIDATRARLGLRFDGLRDPGRSVFWYVLGVDQLAHALVLVGIAGFVL